LNILRYVYKYNIIFDYILQFLIVYKKIKGKCPFNSVRKCLFRRQDMLYIPKDRTGICVDSHHYCSRSFVLTYEGFRGLKRQDCKIDCASSIVAKLMLPSIDRW